MIKKVFRQTVFSCICTNLATLLCMLIDSLMISRYLKADAMAAYSFAGPLLLIFSAVAAMLSGGVQVVCGRTMGNGDREGSSCCYSSTVVLCAGIAVLFTAAVLIFRAPICTLLGAGRPGDKVYELTKDYLLGILPGLPLFMVTIMMAPFVMMSGKRKLVLMTVLSMTAADIILDTLNALVLKGGMLGMGLASAIGYLVAFCFIIRFMLDKNLTLKLSLKKVRPKMWKDTMMAGLPAVVGQISLVAMTYGMNALLSGLKGTVAVAAYSVISTVGNFCYALGGGIGAVTLMLSSVLYGEKNREGLRAVMGCAVRHGLMISLPIAAAVALASSLLTRLFIPDGGELADVTRLGIKLFVICIPFSTLNASVKSYATGVNRAGISQMISVLQNFLMPMAFALLLSRKGVSIVWLCFALGEAMTMMLYALYVRIRFRSVKKQRFLLLPERFGPKKDRILDADIEDIREVCGLSERIRAFAREKGDKPETAMLMGLCAEEILNNILSHGCRAGRSPRVEVRFVSDEKESLLRFRDNAGRFDPVEYAKMHRDDDPAAHIGLRMVMRIAEDVRYVDSMGLNNLTIKVSK